MELSKSPLATPFSRLCDVNKIGEDGLDLTISANPAEGAALALLDGLVAIAGLEARLKIRREGRTGLRVRGEVRARITQTCVVTLDPFEVELSEPIDVHFLPEADVKALAVRPPAPAGLGEAPLDEDLPDPIVGGRIDLGRLAAEFLALGLDPYPRKPGALLSGTAPAAEPEDAAASPFASLIRLKTDPASGA